MKNSEYKKSRILLIDDDKKQNELTNNLKTQNEDSQIISNRPKNASNRVSLKNDSLVRVDITKTNGVDSNNAQDEKSSSNLAKILNSNLNADLQFDEKSQNQNSTKYTDTDSLDKINDSINLNQIKANDLTKPTTQIEDDFKKDPPKNQNNNIMVKCKMKVLRENLN